ncbi:MAG: branched-chain amino acid aminotransferase [Micavibrio aeruginosavorus]|uniref:Branched-chain-amino-acid aminotransferase n=1 Tax=Micavibrio aeruginosavorus TaxID=349221 RepID=A0A2W5N3I9_9BACT|nr:MAG: branched-chain amino acid aminotransferase [Micavibrio aeruginosavorus]
MTTKAFSDRDGFIWVDGKILPWREANIHVLTHGLHYASAVFEGERCYSGNIFKDKAHSDRLIRSADLIDMKMTMTSEEISAAKEDVLKANKLTDAYLRPIAWRGSEQMGISAQATLTHVAIACWEWPSYFSPEMREKGISLQTGKWKAPAPDTAPTQSKAACLYATHTMSKHAAEANGFTDALMLDYRGLVAEATGANIFVIKDGAIRTPIPDCFLNGLTRQTVIDLAKQLKLPIEEARITPEELKAADEVFLTGTAAEVTAVGKIDDTEYKVGPVTRQLRETYEDLVRSKKAIAA